ncbi:MAG: hypothetical protein C7B47_09005 [Sulfobacillus thermosulfidooxidans]|uniref:AB hydrolase-1 domain-containing protein n=1 Tax=Sulfobacillus thermosulfidooxidans TaxID=28034 RepID=A0A2T2WXS6_SULTH|nr:MAG: hypothetical protein C7B47_09005 [Sulfobacillus thermosulfidooxidans]
MEEFIAKTSDGAEIETYFLPAGPLAVILCHGKAFDRDSFVEYGQTLREEGYTVAIPNFRGYGRSTVGQEGVDAIEYDVIAVAKELEAKGHPSVALGASRGGGGVLRAVALNPNQFRAVITWSTVAVSDEVASRLGNIPKLFIVSESEMMHDQTLAVYREAPEPKMLKQIPGGRHAQKIWQGPDRDLIEQYVREFLKAL